MNNFKRGDVVLLKSGGPKMTILEIEDGQIIVCTWFDSKQEIQTKKFHEDLLKKHTPASVRFRSM